MEDSNRYPDGYRQERQFKFQEYKNWLLLPYFDEMREIKRFLVSTHLNSYLSASVLSFYARELTADSVQALYDRLSAK